MPIRNADGPHKSAARNYKLVSDAGSGQGPEAMFSQEFFGRRPYQRSTLALQGLASTFAAALTLSIEVALTAACEFPASRRQFASADYPVDFAAERPPNMAKNGRF